MYRVFNLYKGFTGSFRPLCCVDTKDADKVGLLWCVLVRVGASRDSRLTSVDLGVSGDLGGS